MMFGKGFVKKIMIVDDERKIRRIYRDLLTREGYTVLEAESGGMTDLLLSEKNIGVVLLDLHMPVVGKPLVYDLLKMVDPSIKVIVATVYPPGDHRKLVLEADSYYHKSEDESVLLDTVEMLLKAA